MSFRTRNIARAFLPIFGLAVILFGYQNCSKGFNSNENSSSASIDSPSTTTPTPPTPTTGNNISIYPLELVLPRAAGSAPSAGQAALGASHRIFKAYPGLEYNIRAVVIGGAYPYIFSLSDAPPGMTIDSRTGTIIWLNPQTSATPTITVTDSLGTQRSSNWTINVTTAGFKFIDSARGTNHPTGTGTSTNPWRAISDVVNSPNAVSGDILYFRAGVYNPAGISRSGLAGPWERVEFSASHKPVVWLAYPGETPIIDFGFVPSVDPGVLFRFNGNNVYIDGFETRRSRVIGFQITSPEGNYRVFRRLQMHDLNSIGVDLDGTNSSFIMMTSSYVAGSDEGGSPATWSQYLTIQDNEFYESVNPGLKVYSQWKMLIEDNEFFNLGEGVALKADASQFTVRHNSFRDISGSGIAGNNHSVTTHGEILFNLAQRMGVAALEVNQDSQARRFDIYRNTFIGSVIVRTANSDNGPFYFTNNVLVNSDSGVPAGSHISHMSVADPSRIVLNNNLVGAITDNIVDLNGNLTAAFAALIGSRGYQ